MFVTILYHYMFLFSLLRRVLAYEPVRVSEAEVQSSLSARRTTHRRSQGTHIDRVRSGGLCSFNRSGLVLLRLALGLVLKNRIPG